MAVTEQQVKVFMAKRAAGQSQATAAAQAGLSERTGRRLEKDPRAGTSPPRHWRTREDAFAGVWDEVVAKLEGNAELQALTLLEDLQERYPGQYPDTLLRTLQRRVKAWRAAFGPDKEVMFPQRHEPGQQGLSDFTRLKGVTITIRHVPLEHRLFHFRLAYSGWCHVRVVLGGESYTALAEGLTEALEHLGGVPREHRTDSLEAYRVLVGEVASNINRRNRARITAERAALAPLPCGRGMDYTEAVVRVTTSSTFTYGKVLYSVPARLIGERLRVHVYDDRLVLHHGGRALLTLTRLRLDPQRSRRRCIDYRHVIGWLARKPRALAGLAFRDELLPDAAWRTIYPRLGQQLGTDAACKRVVAGLQLAAQQDCAHDLGAYWLAALERGECPSLSDLQDRFGPAHTPLPPPAPGSAQHALASYDALLQEAAHG
jgi:hypothetical protein